MHTIIETDAFVLRSSPSGEANKSLDLFTERFGLIRATAQGLRYVKSKLRYSLTDFSYARISLVRGKEFWRVTTASKKGDVSSELMIAEARDSMFRIFELLRRLLQGEEPHPELFETVLRVYEMLKDISAQRPAGLLMRISAIEELTVLRILFLLGYVGDDPALRAFVDTADLGEEMLRQSLLSRKVMVAEINRALKASHL